MYPANNQEDPENPNCEEGSAYPAVQIVNTVGKSSSSNACILHMIGTLEFLSVWHRIIIFMVHMVLGLVVEKRSQQQSVEKLPWQAKAV